MLMSNYAPPVCVYICPWPQLYTPSWEKKGSLVQLQMISCSDYLGFLLVPPNYGFGFGRARGVQYLVSVTCPYIIAVLYFYRR